jgi:hypothetical protein
MIENVIQFSKRGPTAEGDKPMCGDGGEGDDGVSTVIEIAVSHDGEIAMVISPCISDEAFERALGAVSGLRDDWRKTSDNGKQE